MELLCVSSGHEGLCSAGLAELQRCEQVQGVLEKE